MPAFVVVDFSPIHEDSLKQYIAAVPSTLMRYDGKFLIRGKSESLLGSSDYGTVAILEFPSKQRARDWYFSPEYQALIPLRDKGMRSQFQLIGN